jgi:CBS domain-containing protein
LNEKVIGTKTIQKTEKIMSVAELKEEILSSVPVGTLVSSKRQVVAVEENATLRDVLQTLGEYHILSVPVKGANGEYSGVLDIRDLVAYVAYGNFHEGEYEFTDDRLQGERLETVTAGDILGLANEIELGMFYDGLYVTEETENLYNALRLLSYGVQRVIVTGERGDHCLSQTDVIRYLSVVDELMEGIGGQTVDNAGLLREEEFNELCTVSSNEITLQAFRKLFSTKADAVAVVDSNNGRLVGTLSASDLRTMYLVSGGSLEKLLLPVSEFLDDIHGGAVRKPIVVKASDSVSKALNRAIAGEVHRLWVVDENFIPTACIRLQDIVTKFGPLDYKHK